MAFYISVIDMLDEFGTDIEVWSYDKIKEASQPYIGGPVIDTDTFDLTEIDPEKRHEPVVPMSTTNSIISQYIGGGVSVQGDLLWISTGTYEVGTLVKVPTQDSKNVFKVTNISNYKDYSDAVIYELKGDKQHDSGY